MKDFMKRIRADFLFSSLICIVAGLVLCIWPGEVNALIGTVIGIILIVIGAIYLIGYAVGMIRGISAIMGAVVAVVGILILINPGVVGIIIPTLLGIILLVHGIRGIRESSAAKKFGYAKWSVGAVSSIVFAAFGVLCIFGAIFGKFGVVNWPYIAVGVLLILNGISNIYIASTTAGYERKYNKSMEIQGQFKEDTETEV